MLSILSGRLSGSRRNVKSNKRNRRQGRRLLRVESLERREMLAGGPIPDPVPPVPVVFPDIVVENVAVPRLDILPGAINQVVAEWNVSMAGRNFGRLGNEFLVVPAMGSGRLAWTANIFSLRADLNADSADGCETTLATAQVDYETDLLDFNLYQQPWIRQQPLRVQLVVDRFSTWMSSDKFGVELAEIDNFRDLRNRLIPAENVNYTGVAPVLHHLEKETVQVSQQYDAGATVAYAGQTEVPMLTFYAWGNGGALTDLEVVASKGDMGNVSESSLWARDWRGTRLIEEGVVPQNGKLSFNLAANFVNGAEYQVRATIATALTPDSYLMLGFPYDGAGLKGIQIESGRPLRGVAVNGGAGQIQLWTSKSMTYEFRTPVQDHLYVSEISKESASWPVSPGTQNITFDSFYVMRASDFWAFITQVTVSAAEGDVRSCEKWALWGDTDRDGRVDMVLSKGNVVNNGDAYQVVFDDPLPLLEVEGWLGKKLEVRANVSTVPVSKGLRTQLKGIQTTLPSDLVHLENALQPYWDFSGYGGEKG